MAQLLSVAWSTNGVAASGSVYLNAGDRIEVTYTFDSSPGMRSGDRIQLSNGQYAGFSVRSGNTATFVYEVTSGTTNTSSLSLTSTTIMPGDRTTAQSGFTYGVGSASPSTPIVIDTIAPPAPSITSISPDTDPVGDHATASQSVTLSGTAEAGSTVTIFQNGVSIGTTQADNSGAWTFAVPGALADKTSYDFTARSTDLAGNQGATSTTYPVNVDTAICFCAGTLIRTADGEAPVETLKIGDLVVAHAADGSSALQPIRWIGRQTISMAFADPNTAYPVRIAAGALGEALPARDLSLSPEHALYLEGVLVQAGALVNGLTVRRLTRPELPETFVYFHVELEHHGLILAEGALAETFVDNVTRRRFDNWAEHEALYGADDVVIAELDLPRVQSPRQLPAALRAATRQAA